MKIAVPYENGNVFPHFGKTSEFKIYTFEDGAVSNEIVPASGEGHDALAAFLAEAGVEAVVCGGIGEHAMAALAEAGIEVVSGAEGNADQAVAGYIAGQLMSQEANCEGGCGGNCGSDDGEECGGGCSGCGGGCGGPRPVIYEGKNAGKSVKVHYTGTLDDGSKFDSSYDRNEPLSFICGTGMMIPGFDKAVVDMNVGDSVKVHLDPADAYGEVDPQAIFDVEIAQLPGSENLSVGERIGLANEMGQRFPVIVKAKTETTITFDANHDLAGKALNFEIELVSVED